MTSLWFLMVHGLLRYTGGLLGAHVVVDVPQPTVALVNVCVAGRPIIVDGRATTTQDGRVQMDDYMRSRLRSRGISIESMEVHDDHILVMARLPLVGTRRVTLTRE